MTHCRGSMCQPISRTSKCAYVACLGIGVPGAYGVSLSALSGALTTPLLRVDVSGERGEQRIGAGVAYHRIGCFRACALRFREGYTDGQMSAEPQRMRDIAAAVAAEREACAAVVEAELAILMGPARDAMQLGSVRSRIKELAAAIRARGGT